MLVHASVDVQLLAQHTPKNHNAVTTYAMTHCCGHAAAAAAAAAAEPTCQGAGVPRRCSCSTRMTRHGGSPGSAGGTAQHRSAQSVQRGCATCGLPLLRHAGCCAHQQTPPAEILKSPWYNMMYQRATPPGLAHHAHSMAQVCLMAAGVAACCCLPGVGPGAQLPVVGR
jgi:hypothetical protein